MVVEFTNDLIQIFILNLSIGPPYYKGGCCRLIQVVKVLQFEMEYFLWDNLPPKLIWVGWSGPRPDDPACQPKLSASGRMIRPGWLFLFALGRMIRPIRLKSSVACRMIRPWEFWRPFRAQSVCWVGWSGHRPDDPVPLSLHITVTWGGWGIYTLSPPSFMAALSQRPNTPAQHWFSLSPPSKSLILARIHLGIERKWDLGCGKRALRDLSLVHLKKHLKHPRFVNLRLLLLEHCS
jgi:hypothetical protein